MTFYRSPQDFLQQIGYSGPKLQSRLEDIFTPLEARASMALGVPGDIVRLVEIENSMEFFEAGIYNSVYHRMRADKRELSSRQLKPLEALRLGAYIDMYNFGYELGSHAINNSAIGSHDNLLFLPRGAFLREAVALILNSITSFAKGENFALEAEEKQPIAYSAAS